MSQQASGVIDKVFTRKTATNKTIWSFRLVNDPRYFRTGFTKPNAEEGNQVTFRYNEDQYGNQVEVNSVVASANTAPVVNPTAPSERSPSMKENFEARAKYWEDKEKNDVEVRKEIR